jgi:hypothetical protein
LRVVRCGAYGDSAESLEPEWRPQLAARWSFGDGETSEQAHPVHEYGKAGEYVVTLEVEGPAGRARWTKVRDVVVE